MSETFDQKSPEYVARIRLLADKIAEDRVTNERKRIWLNAFAEDFRDQLISGSVSMLLGAPLLLWLGVKMKLPFNNGVFFDTLLIYLVGMCAIIPLAALMARNSANNLTKK